MGEVKKRHSPDFRSPEAGISVISGFNHLSGNRAHFLREKPWGRGWGPGVKWNLDLVPREWGNLFVKSRIHYIEHLHLTNFPEKYQNVRYIEVKLIINLQNPAFPHLKNYCTELYKATAPGTQETKLLKTSVHINFILIIFPF